jgi:O-antigen/teichoic acid export membrane protein
VLLGVLAPPAELGFYVVAVSLAELVAAAVLSGSEVVGSTTTRRGESSLLARSTRLTIALSVLAAAGMATGAPLVVPWLFGDAFSNAIVVTWILLVASLPYHLSLVLGMGLAGMGHPGSQSIAQVAGLVTSLMALLWLAPDHGALGAAWATLIGYTTTAGLAILASKKHLGLNAGMVLVPRRSDLHQLTNALHRTRG